MVFPHSNEAGTKRQRKYSVAIFLEPISCKLILCNKVGGGVESAAGEVVEVIYKKAPFHVCLHTLIFSTLRFV